MILRWVMVMYAVKVFWRNIFLQLQSTIRQLLKCPPTKALLVCEQYSVVETNEYVVIITRITFSCRAHACSNAPQPRCGAVKPCKSTTQQPTKHEPHTDCRYRRRLLITAAAGAVGAAAAYYYLYAWYDR